MIYWSRVVALMLFRALGELLDWLRRPLPKLLLSVGAVTAALAAAGWAAGVNWPLLVARSAPVARRLAALDAGTASVGRWLTAWNVLSIWAFLLVGWSIWRARRQLVIGRFEDFSEKTAGLSSAGFGALVATQLASLNALFRDFDAGQQFQATRGALTGLNAAFLADGAADSLDTAVSSEASFALGPIKLPVGVVVGLIGRLVRGPTLTGHIHRDGPDRIVTVRLAGSLGSRTWLITERVQHDEKGAESWKPALELADGVAHRVFTELSIGPTVRWEALAEFSRGVRAYRTSLRIARERLLNLRVAERRLIAAQGEDENFDLAYYNLGIVYTELAAIDRAKRGQLDPAYGNMLDAAVSAFEQAREKGPSRWCTKYALAHTSLRQAIDAFNVDRPQAALLHLSTALDFGNDALRCAPDNAARAQTISVIAGAAWWRAWRLNPDEPNAIELQRAGTVARRGARTAWRALCRARLTAAPQRGDVESPRERSAGIAAASLRDLAQIQLFYANIMGGVEAPSRGMRWTRRSLLKQATGSLTLARALAPNDAELCADLGTALQSRGKWAAAAKAWRAATRLDPNNSEAWAALALALANTDDRQAAREAALRIFTLGHLATSEAIAQLQQANARQLGLFEEIGELANERAAATGMLQRARFLVRFFRLSWRLGERRVLSFGVASTRLAQLAVNPEALAPYRADLDAIAKRADGLYLIRQETSRLRDKGGDGIEELSALLQQQREAEHPWEVGDVGFALGDLYFQQEELDKALAVFRDLVAFLDSSLHSEIKRRGLHVVLSRILRLQGQPAEALAQAHRAIQRDPLSAFERIELGRVYFDLEEYANAQQAFEDALKFAPNDPELHRDAARAQLLQVHQCKTKEARAARLESARQELAVALDLYDREEGARQSARYDLANVEQYLGNAHEGLRELRALRRSGYCPLMMRLEIADALLSTQEWVESEEEFVAVAAELDAEAEQHGADHVPERPWDSDHVLGTASAWAHLGIASTYSERDIKLAEALAHVEKARESLQKTTTSSVVATWLAACDYVEGEIRLKQDSVEPAIASLERALHRRVDSNTYLKCAEALARRIELAGKGTQHAPTARRAMDYLAEAERLDFTNRNAAIVDRLQAKLQLLSP